MGSCVKTMDVDRVVLKRRRRAGGWALVQAMTSIIAMSLFCSMAVDIGIYYTARTELERAADAAALAAAGTIQQGGDLAAAQAAAVTYAQSNKVFGQVLPAGAVTVTAGAWTNNAFVANAAPITAVQVKVQRSQSKNNPLTIFFGNIMGVSNVNVAAVSTARLRPAVPDYKIVGIDQASFASIGVLASINGRFVSNGNVSVGRPLGIGVSVVGDARSYGGSVQKGFLAGISGSTSALSTQLIYPSNELPYANDNAQIAAYLDSQANFSAIVGATLPAGVYVVNDLNILAGVGVNLLGPVTFYVQGNFNFGVGVNLLGSSSFSAENFKVRVMKGGNVYFLATILTPVNMDLYAPDSGILIAAGLNQYKGRLIGKTLTIALPLPGVITEESGLTDPFAALNKVLVVH